MGLWKMLNLFFYSFDFFYGFILHEWHELNREFVVDYYD